MAHYSFVYYAERVMIVRVRITTELLWKPS